MFQNIFKLKYENFDENVTTFRGVLHGSLWPLFLYLNYPVISLCYLISFFYHRINYNETLLRYLDIHFIFFRIISFPDCSKYSYRYLFLISFPIIHHIIYYSDLEKFKYNSINLYLKFLNKTNYYTIMRVLVFIQSFILFFYDSHFIIIKLLYILPWIIYIYKPNFFWHNNDWKSHDDFHFLLLIVDFIYIYNYDLFKKS